MCVWWDFAGQNKCLSFLSETLTGGSHASSTFYRFTHSHTTHSRFSQCFIRKSGHLRHEYVCCKYWRGRGRKKKVNGAEGPVSDCRSECLPQGILITSHPPTPFSHPLDDCMYVLYSPSDPWLIPDWTEGPVENQSFHNTNDHNFWTHCLLPENRIP